ncbi:hypothetical protein EW026_g3618 [Hermanssonia centrifuga]|uniref:Protein kinase domain-containing protein n=1 Tax=Hermanssonia centrifuga TaxID=98765 RepID=A0A4S4KK26_9APHY|nr:hypothetical protein EW026_g3618 [Hermanssonia centrifuga]
MDSHKIVKKLKRMGTRSRRPITKHNRWWGFNVDPIDRTPGIKLTSFSRLADVVRDIIRAGAIHGQEPSLYFCNNQQPVFGYGRDATCLPDAYFVMMNVPETRSSWERIAVSGEYNVVEWCEKENVVKVSESMCNIMREDPRRRFTFGFTIEDTEMKLWYCDRSQTVASQPFNFITDHETLVHFFLSLAYASPVQLGWDPTIAIQEHDLQYRITIQSVDGTECVYRTLEVLFDSAASVMHGPGTRVWKVVQIVDGHDYGDPVVLKDCWVSCDRQREGTIHEKLRNAKPSDAFREAFDDSFLTVELHGDVIIDPGMQRQPDRTPLILPPEEMKKKGYNIPPVSATLKPRAAKSLWREITYTKSSPQRKVHYRIVFREICKPIKGATSLQDVFKTLGEVCSALKLMHQTGWVHRDVSVGNILIDSHGKARLSDLEYAKDMNDQSDPEFRIGTANFVAVEVQSQDYQFRPLILPTRAKQESQSI